MSGILLTIFIVRLLCGILSLHVYYKASNLYKKHNNIIEFWWLSMWGAMCGILNIVYSSAYLFYDMDKLLFIAPILYFPLLILNPLFLCLTIFPPGEESCIIKFPKSKKNYSIVVIVLLIFLFCTIIDILSYVNNWTVPTLIRISATLQILSATMVFGRISCVQRRFSKYIKAGMVVTILSGVCIMWSNSLDSIPYYVNLALVLLSYVFPVIAVNWAYRVSDTYSKGKVWTTVY